MKNIFQGFCEDIALYPGSADNIYCAGQIWSSPFYVMALHKTTNGGKDWTSHRITDESGIGHTVAVASRNKNVVYVGGYRNNVGALYKSTDGGITWTELGKSVFNIYYKEIKDIAIDPEINNRIYVGNGNGLYKSKDGGITWDRIHTYPVNAILINPFETDEIYAAGTSGVMFSSDGGNSWSDISTNLGVRDTLCLDMNPVNEILYTGSNGGSVFQKGLLEKFSLIIQAGEGGTTNPGPGSYTYEKGERVTLTAIPDPNYVFSGWTGSVTDQNNPMTLTMDNDKTITANFKLALFPPISLKGEKVTNRSLLLVQRINVLSWEAHPENTGIVEYRIYVSQDGTMQKLGEVGANSLYYWHVGVEKDREYRYGICAVNQNGQESEPAFITIR
jgi:uncharacterized repeat protein (TIGR02543 family)